MSVHIGSQITDVEPFTLAMERVAELVRDLRKDGHGIEYVDAGGGLGIPYERADGPDFGQYASALLAPLKGLKVHLLLEPGRSIVGPAGALLTRVLYRKTNNGKKFVIVDAAMNDLLRPSLYNAYHEIVPVCAEAGRRDRDRGRGRPGMRDGRLLRTRDARFRWSLKETFWPSWT